MAKGQSSQPQQPQATAQQANYIDMAAGVSAPLQNQGGLPQMSTSFLDSGGSIQPVYQNLGGGQQAPTFTQSDAGATPTQAAPPGYYYDANGTLLLGGSDTSQASTAATGANPAAVGASPGTLANGMPNFGPTTTNVQGGAIQPAIGNVGAIQGSIQGGGPIQSTLAPSGSIQSQVALPNGSYANSAAYGAIQNQLDRSNLPELVSGDALRGMTDDARNAAYAVQQAYLDPAWNDRMTALENKLVNQGVMQNSEAWNRAMSQAAREREFEYSQARNNAFSQGLSAQNQLFGQGLATRQNMFGEELSAGQFANAAQQQGFGQSLANAQLQNQARQMSVQDAMNQMALNNAAQSQQFGQNLAGAQFGNQAAAQNLAQNLALGNFANTAQNQNFAQNLAGAQYGLAAQGQQFGQGMANANLANSTQNQLAQQWLANQGLLTSTRNAEISGNAQLGAANAAASASQNNVQAQLAAQAQQNAFNNSMAYNNMLYNQGLGLGNYYGNMLNGLYGGPGANGGVIAPNFTNTPGAQVGGTDVGGIYNMGYQGQLNNYNAAMGNYNSGLGGLFGLGTAAMMAPAGGFLAGLLPSDRRLKENVRRIGVHATAGVPVYEYDYLWGEHAIGVMADEVEAVLPQAVLTLPNGYKAVDYARL